MPEKHNLEVLPKYHPKKTINKNKEFFFFFPLFFFPKGPITVIENTI